MAQTQNTPSPLQRRHRRARRLLRAAFFASLLLALLFALSCIAFVRCDTRGNTQAASFTLGYGYLMIQHYDLSDRTRITLNMREGWRLAWRLRWPTLAPRYRHSGPRTMIVIPTWIPLAVVALPTAVAFAIHRRRRPGPNDCQNCGYDLTGNTTGVCPECGGAVATNG